MPLTRPTSGDPGADGSATDLTVVLDSYADAIEQAQTDIAGKQPLDSDLTAIAALSTTSYGRALLALADAAAGRTALGLGTAATAATGDFQPADSDLTAIAALSTTSYGRAFLALADAAAGRTALGLGTAAVAASGDFEAAGAVATHSADTTSVHGIADTSALETTTGAQAKVDTHVNDTTAAHAASAISVDASGFNGNLTTSDTTVQAVAQKLDDLSASGSPTTTRGDLIYRGASADTRLPIGSAGKFLTSDGTDPVWSSASLTGGFFNVKDTAYGAVGDGTNDDTAEINAAIAAVNASTHGGTLFFPAGIYKVTSALTTLTKPARIIGEGRGTLGTAGGVPSTLAISEIRFNHATANLFTIGAGAEGSSFADLAMTNTLTHPSRPTAGAAIDVSATGSGDGMAFNSISVYGFYTGINITDGACWAMSDSIIMQSVMYGMYIGHADLVDGGDQSITGSHFYTTNCTSTTSGSAHIKQVSGGGLKIANCKFNGYYGESTNQKWAQYGIDLAIGAGVATSDLLVTGTSIEAYQSAGVRVVQSSTGTFYHTVIVGNQFAQNVTGAKGVEMSGTATTALRTVTIGGNVFGGSGSGTGVPISLTNVGGVTISGNAYFGASWTASGGTYTSCTGIVNADAVSTASQTGLLPDLPDSNGTAYKLDGSGSWTRTGKVVTALTDGTNIAVNCDTTDIGTVTLGGNRTLSNPTGTPSNGQQLIIRVKQDATGSRTLAYGSAYRFSTDVPSPTLTTTAGQTDYLGFVYNSADSKWDLLAITKGF